jgi:tetratricopeptide (TPR) repeat protein
MTRIRISSFPRKRCRWEFVFEQCLNLGLTAATLSGVCFAQSSPTLRYNVKYRCGGETIVVGHCRHDSDMAGFPPTTPPQDFCAVYYPDRPTRNGFEVEKVELRGNIIGKLESCGALPKSANTPTPQSPPSPSMTAEEYIKQAEPYFNTKDARKAIAPLQKAIALNPSVTAYNDLGIAYINLHQYTGSASAFEQAVRLDPNDANIHLNLGLAYLKAEKYDNAVATFREALRLKPDFPDAANQLGIALDDSKRYPEAIAAYKQTIHLDPGYTDAYSNLGNLYLEMHKRDDALEVYRELQKQSQDDADDLYLQIIEADANSKKGPSETERAKAYSKLGVSTLLAKASKGDDAAMKRLSDVYYEQHDSANGLKWEIKAAEHGDPELQNELAARYENGSGAPKSASEARNWYRRAGEQGYDSAQLHLCQSYAAELDLDHGVLTGADKDDLASPILPIRGPKVDIDEAFRWCERGANQGMYLAAWYAGVLNARGSPGHPPDYSEAYFWLSNAGLRAGTAFRQKIGKHLTASQRAEIEKRAANFHPPPLEFLNNQIIKHSAHQQ